MKSLWKNIFGFVMKSHRREVYDQLQWQRFLLRTGVPATAQVLDMVQEGEEVYNYVMMRFWVRLTLKGHITYQHMQTLISKKDIPVIGQTIHIRYCPDDLSKIIIV